MEVHFTPDQEAKLAQIAARTGTDTERLVKNAALRLVAETARFRATVREGIAQADQGELIDDDEVRLCLTSKSTLEAHSLDSSGHQRPTNNFRLYRSTP